MRRYSADIGRMRKGQVAQGVLVPGSACDAFFHGRVVDFV
jgi:hypothetical protein